MDITTDRMKVHEKFTLAGSSRDWKLEWKSKKLSDEPNIHLQIPKSVEQTDTTVSKT